MMLVDFFLAQLYGIVPEQKAMQLDEESHFLLHDIACLWIYLRPKMAATFPGEVVKRHEDLFHKGAVVACIWGSPVPIPLNSYNINLPDMMGWPAPKFQDRV